VLARSCDELDAPLMASIKSDVEDRPQAHIKCGSQQLARSGGSESNGARRKHHVLLQAQEEVCHARKLPKRTQDCAVIQDKAEGNAALLLQRETVAIPKTVSHAGGSVGGLAKSPYIAELEVDLLEESIDVEVAAMRQDLEVTHGASNVCADQPRAAWGSPAASASWAVAYLQCSCEQPAKWINGSKSLLGLRRRIPELSDDGTQRNRRGLDVWR
jgi:hypothetical protein